MDLPSRLRSIRHAPLLERAAWLWDTVRPWYDTGLRVLYGRRGIPLLVGGGERIRVDPTCRSYVWGGELGEDEFWAAVMDEIRAGDRIADIGANIGVYTIAAARRGALVTSYEPNPATARVLRRNLDLNGVTSRVTILEVAVADTEGELRLLPQGVLDVSARIDAAGDIPVEATTLVDVFDLLKIDVEGYELEVLRGAAPLLVDPERRPRAVFLELHTAQLERAGIDPQAFRALLPRYTVTKLGARALTEHWVARAETSR